MTVVSQVKQTLASLKEYRVLCLYSTRPVTKKRNLFLEAEATEAIIQDLEKEYGFGI